MSIEIDISDDLGAPDDFGPPDVPHRRVKLTRASDIKIRPVTWAWSIDGAGRIPAGSLCIAAGREGTGKSSCGIWLAAQITQGTLPGSYYGTPRSVFYVAVEDSWQHTIAPRLMAAGADLDRVFRFEVITDTDEEVTLSLPVDNRLLEVEISDNDVALVVLDPVMSVIGEKIDTHREREVRMALDPLAKIADRTSSVILGIAHFNKSAGTDAASLITGSGAFKNVPRSVFGFARDESDNTRVMTQVKNSLGRDDLPSFGYTIETALIDTDFGPAETGRFVFTGESQRTVADILRDSRGDDDDRSERDEASDFIRGYLADLGGTAPAVDVIKAGRASGYSENTMKKARKRAGAESNRHGFGPGSSVTWTIDSPIGAIDATNENLAPMAPMEAPMEPEPEPIDLFAGDAA